MTAELGTIIMSSITNLATILCSFEHWPLVIGGPFLMCTRGLPHIPVRIKDIFSCMVRVSVRILQF